MSDLTNYDIYCMDISDLKDMSENVHDYQKLLIRKSNTLLKVQDKIKNKMYLSTHDHKIIYGALQHFLDEIKECEESNYLNNLL
mmetsp:Transcript_10785/g.14061  ORF Transcript_10785/g.14061 Transcript_10785/m.14061 type:complete len:84 (-) Transcript_10785:22-273(-)